MARRFLPIMTGHSLPKIWQPREAEPSIINEEAVAAFTRVVERTGILCPELAHPAKEQG